MVEGFKDGAHYLRVGHKTRRMAQHEVERTYSDLSRQTDRLDDLDDRQQRNEWAAQRMSALDNPEAEETPGYVAPPDLDATAEERKEFMEARMAGAENIEGEPE